MDLAIVSLTYFNLSSSLNACAKQQTTLYELVQRDARYISLFTFSSLILIH